MKSGLRFESSELSAGNLSHGVPKVGRQVPMH